MFFQLLLMGLVPVAEALHEHEPLAGIELHNAGEDCEHGSHPAECSLLRVGTVSALPAPSTSPALRGTVVVTHLAPISSVAFQDAPLSSGLPRAPPLA